MSGKGTIRAIFVGDRQADRLVPPSGSAARLTLFSTAVMAFLAVFALALALATGRLATQWGEELTGSATVRVMAPAEEVATQTAAALAVLETTTGVTEAELLSDADQAALLAPWFGTDMSLEGLPVPRLIALRFDPGRFDAVGLRLRLAAEVPAAVLDDHGRWRAPLAQTSSRLRILAWGVGVLIVSAVAAVVTLAVNAALAANAQVVAVLRLVGATDRYITSAFIRRFTLRAFWGAILGTLVGLAVLAMLRPAASTPTLLTGLGFQGAGWLVPALVPLLSAAVAILTTTRAAQRMLKELA